MHVNINETMYLITHVTQCLTLQSFFSFSNGPVMLCWWAVSAYTRHRRAYNRTYHADVSAVATRSGGRSSAVWRVFHSHQMFLMFGTCNEVSTTNSVRVFHSSGQGRWRGVAVGAAQGQQNWQAVSRKPCWIICNLRPVFQGTRQSSTMW